MRIEATPESARTVIRPVAVVARIPNADAAQIPMFLRNPRSSEEEETKTISSARLLK